LVSSVSSVFSNFFKVVSKDVSDSQRELEGVEIKVSHRLFIGLFKKGDGRVENLIDNRGGEGLQRLLLFIRQIGMEGKVFSNSSF